MAFILKNNNNKMDNIFQSMFMDACALGQFDMAKELYQIHHRNITITNIIFEGVCVRGDLEFTKWLFSLKPDLIDNNFGALFHKICLKGKIEMAIWLDSIKPNIDQLYYFYAFDSSCENGHIEVAKWLYSFLKNPVNLPDSNDKLMSRYIDMGFIGACQKGHLNIIIWLLSIENNLTRTNPNELMNKDAGFYHACISGHLEIVKLLCELYPYKYKYNIDNDNENKIKPKILSKKIEKRYITKLSLCVLTNQLCASKLNIMDNKQKTLQLFANTDLVRTICEFI